MRLPKKQFQILKNTDAHSPLLVGDHSQCRLRKLVVDGVVYGTHIQIVVAKSAAHGKEQRDGIRFVFHCGEMEGSILEFHTMR